jgi:hypothetical protein
MLTVIATGSQNYQYSFDNGSTWQTGADATFTDNTSGTIIVRDSMYRTASTGYYITNINRDKPICGVTYDITTPTSTSVIASLTACNKPVAITNTSVTPCQGGASEVQGEQCTFMHNGNFTFEFVDLRGNTGSTTATVTWITSTTTPPTPPSSGGG